MENLLRGFQENKAFRISTLLVLILVIVAVSAPLIAPYDPLDAIMKDANMEPSAAHLFGTDKLGRDVLSRILYGASYSLSSVLVLVSAIFIVGTTLGVLAGYFGGKVDIIIMRIADMMISFPGMILAIAIAGIMGGSLVNAMIALLVVTWTKYARLARSMVLKVKKRDCGGGCGKWRNADSYFVDAYCPQYLAFDGDYGRSGYRGDDDGTGRFVVFGIWQSAACS